MPRKSSRKIRSRRKGCSNAPKRKCRSRKNCTWKKSRGCRRRSNINKYEIQYRSVVKRSRRPVRRSRKPRTLKGLNSYTSFVKANINDMTATTQAGRMKQVARLWKKSKSARSPSKRCKNGIRRDGKCRKSPCRRGFRKRSRVCRRKPGPKSRSR